jgi:5-methylcytosine-specific restriction endonuclease McrA
MMNNRRMPTEARIRAHWVDQLWLRKGFDSPTEFLEPGICFACGYCWSRGVIPPQRLTRAAKAKGCDHGHSTLQRAHILARCNGGGDDASNLHMLCDQCHRDSEALDGEKYWSWFWQRSWMDVAISAACRMGLNLHSEYLAAKKEGACGSP